MSANIYFRQDQPVEGQDVDTATPRSFWEKLEMCFYDHGNEIRLGPSDLPTLRGLAAFNKDYYQLIAAIANYGPIVVYKGE